MSKPSADRREFEKTPVDDVRVVRERLSREAGGDIRKLVENSRRFAKEYAAKLGLKIVGADSHSPRRRARRSRRVHDVVAVKQGAK